VEDGFRTESRKEASVAEAPIPAADTAPMPAIQTGDVPVFLIRVSLRSSASSADYREEAKQRSFAKEFQFIFA
jgi:hypothetical protein